MLNHSSTLTNTELLDLWLHGKSKNTIDGYRRHAERFFCHVNKPLADCTLMDIQLWVMTLHCSDNSKRVAVGAIKSLLSFAKQLGVVSANLGILIKSPKAKNRLAERILTQEKVQLLISSTKTPRDKQSLLAARDRAIIRLLYLAGLRVSELLRAWTRADHERLPSPSEAIVDSQSVESANLIHLAVGYDAAKKIKGRKRI